MKHRARRRQLLLIVVAVLLPAAVLIGLVRRVTRQEAELAEAHAARERRNQIDQLGRELAARLEAIKLQEINRWIRIPAAPESEQPPDAALVFVAALDGDRIILPWESNGGLAEPSPDFLRQRQQAESLEFEKDDPAAALEYYRHAAAAARRPGEKCEARLFEARVLLKARRAAEASRVYKSMLKDCDSAADQDGIPFGLYASERLMNSLKDFEQARGYALARVNRVRWTNPYETYMIRSLLKLVPDEETVAALNGIDRRLADIDRIQAFAKDFRRVRALAETAWIAYGSEPWLVTVIPPQAPLPSLVFVVSSTAAARKFLPPSASLVGKDTVDSEPLGPAFHAINLRFEPGSGDGRRRPVNSSFYAIGIASTLLVTTLTVLLLLRDVNRELRLADMRSHFVASVSHELKTPLTAIRMFAETLALGRARDNRTRTEYLETIVNESERLTRLVDNVLDFSKIEQGKKIYQLRPTSLSDVARSAAQALQYPLAQQGFTLNVSLDETVPAVPADPDAMKQAVLNLLSNAMKYSGNARQIDLIVKGTAEDAILEVTDRGLGIAPHERARIFEKFYRARSTDRDSIAGTGLGLTVVQHIVEAHSGSIEVRSVEGKGSTFCIRIPFARVEHPE